MVSNSIVKLHQWAYLGWWSYMYSGSESWPHQLPSGIQLILIFTQVDSTAMHATFLSTHI